jgi:hypothetical protein
MSEDKWRRTPCIMALKSVHVRTTNTNRTDPKQHLTRSYQGDLMVTIFKLMGLGINKRFHFAI